jgi:hypothetical protein
MSHDNQRPVASHGLHLRVTKAERDGLMQEAEQCGYDLSTLLRLRIFGEIKGMRITRKPSTDIAVLGDMISRLTALTGELNKIGSNLNQIAKRLNQGSRDMFGLESCLRLYEQTNTKVLQVLNLTEAAITGRLKQRHGEDE